MAEFAGKSEPTSEHEDDLTHYMNCCARQRERAERAEADNARLRRLISAASDILGDWDTKGPGRAER